MENKNLIPYAIIAILVSVVIVLLMYMGQNSGGQAASNRDFFSSAIGKTAPDFSLQGLDGNIVKLSDYRGKNVVLFFNEGQMCYPACWDQIREFGIDPRFNSSDTVAFSITGDSRNQWQKIAEDNPEYKNAKILFDTSRVASSEYGVLSLPSSMHRGSLPGHTYLIIDKGGVVRFTLDDPSMALRNDQLAAEIDKLISK